MLLSEMCMPFKRGTSGAAIHYALHYHNKPYRQRVELGLLPTPDQPQKFAKQIDLKGPGSGGKARDGHLIDHSSARDYASVPWLLKEIKENSIAKI
jgi:hypothetical protein